MYFINTTNEKKKCGVYQMGKAVYNVLKPLGFIYTEDLSSLPKNCIYIFNWHEGTNLGVLNKQWLSDLGGKSIGFLHDPYNNPDFFDIKARVDPNFKDMHPFYGLPRIITEYEFPEVNRDKIIISSWGFGMGHKSYDYIVNKIEAELEGVTIRLHIPFSDWWDRSGYTARLIAQRCRQLVKRNTIEITHDYMEIYDFLKWANESTINVFACDVNLVAGISSCVDMALMAKRPIGVNKCMQFRSVFSENTSLHTNTLMEIVQKGQDHLDKYRKVWTEENFRAKINELIGKLDFIVGSVPREKDYKSFCQSQAFQDIFVFETLNRKLNGTFVEIGVNHPVMHNNTYLLHQHGWKGLMVEYDRSFEQLYKQLRPNCISVIQDTRTVDYRGILDSNYPTDIDYLQIDLEVDNRSTLDVLELFDRTVFDKYRFATVTFEHDIYRGNYFDTKKISQEIFKKHGYVLAFENVSVMWEGRYCSFEDWYIHPELVKEYKTGKDLSCDFIKSLYV